MSRRQGIFCSWTQPSPSGLSTPRTANSGSGWMVGTFTGIRPSQCGYCLIVPAGKRFYPMGRSCRSGKIPRGSSISCQTGSNCCWWNTRSCRTVWRAFFSTLTRRSNKGFWITARGRGCCMTRRKNWKGLIPYTLAGSGNRRIPSVPRQSASGAKLALSVHGWSTASRKYSFQGMRRIAIVFPAAPPSTGRRGNQSACLSCSAAR